MISPTYFSSRGIAIAHSVFDALWVTPSGAVTVHTGFTVVTTSPFASVKVAVYLRELPSRAVSRPTITQLPVVCGFALSPLSTKILHLLLLCPSSEVSAGACYKKYDELPKTLEWKESATQGCIDALTKKNENEGGRYLMNDLYIPALHLNPDVETAYNEAKSFSPLGVTMSGSGSCVFALFETKELCQWAYSRYKGKFRAYVAETVIPEYSKTKKTFGFKNPFVLSDEEIADADGE